MQTRVFLAAAAAFSLCAAPAFAAPITYATAKLAAPLAQPRTVTMGGLDWNCSGDTCVGATAGTPGTWNTMYSCKKVAGTFGELAGFSNRGVALSDSSMSICNKAATAAAPAATAGAN